MDRAETLHDDPDEGGRVITLVDPEQFETLVRLGRRGSLASLSDAAPLQQITTEDLPLEASLLIIPPLHGPISILSPDALLEIFQKRQVGVVSNRVAHSLRRVCRAFEPWATEAAFERVVLTPQILELADDILAVNGTSRASVGTNEKSAIGVQALMISLIQRWGRHVRVVGQPDEWKAARLLVTMAGLQSVSWEHPHMGDHDPVDYPIVRHGGTCYNIPGLQGLALGQRLGGRVRLSIKGMPLAGLARRVGLYLTGNDAMDDGDFEDANGVDVLRPSTAGLVKLRLTVSAHPDYGDIMSVNIDASTMVASRTPSQADMAALKNLLLAASSLESLTIRGNTENEPDGYAGAYIPNGNIDNEQWPGCAFYLPAFQFAPGDRLPPLSHLHLWRYDWRRHSAADVAAHWNLSQLRTLIFDGAPLRRFLGTLELSHLGHLNTLRVEDAEWALQPDESRQAALILGMLLHHYIHRLKRLELVRVYTDNLPLAAIRRHAASLEHLVLRHPYGLGFGTNAGTPSAAPLLLLALLQRGEDAEGSNTEVVMTPSEQDTHSEASDNMQSSAGDVTPTSTTGSTTGSTSESTTGSTTESTASSDTLPSIPRVDGRLCPTLSHLLSLEIDLDERYMEGDDEAEILTRLVRLPQLRSVSLAVPSVLRGLSCVPKYDVDLHNVLARLVFLLGQRQQRMQQQHQLRLQNGARFQGPTVTPLKQVIFYTAGWAPKRGHGLDDHHGHHTYAKEERDENVRENGMVNLASSVLPVMDTSTTFTAAATAAPVPVATLSVRPPSAMFPPASPMMTTINPNPSAAGRSFLQTDARNELDVTAGVGAALALRGQALRAQRCFVAELRRPETVEGYTAESFNGEDTSDNDDDNTNKGGDHSPHDSSKLVYCLYEEYNDEYDFSQHDQAAAYVNEHGVAVSYQDAYREGVRQRVRTELPFIVQFAQPADLAELKWDVLGLPLWA